VLFRSEKLLKFQPLENHEIHAWGEDEEEEIWHDENDDREYVWKNLRDFLLACRVKIE
jgi:hypothetical protein